MNLLGLDPGLEALGYGIVGTEPFSLLNMGVVAHKKDPTLSFNEDLNIGLKNIGDQFQRLIMLYDPKQIAAEIVPVGKLGSRSETSVAAITVCKTLAYAYGIPWKDYGANTVKSIVTQDGTASKAQVRNAILALFPEWEPLHKKEKQRQKTDESMKRPPGIPQDAFDGAAIAVTHYFKEFNES